MSDKQTSTKMGDWFRNILSCCDREDEEDERPTLQIVCQLTAYFHSAKTCADWPQSGPTDFRREDIRLPGLDPEQQRWIREKAIADAGRTYEHLSPLRASPSGQFADRNHTATLPSYEDFTTPRSAPAPATAPAPAPVPVPPAFTARRTSVGSQALDRVRAHTRKISSSLGKPMGYQAGGKEHGSPYEMRSLMDPSQTHVLQAGKLSGESFSVAGSEEERDSAKGGQNIKF
ncbi:hypothetical protein LTR53_003646 [Teratosphaeriaceae sp. CCFEE 6253]|nr:hypothetical protein LTR53_003646 [Teratosphaeriaceae sp. CCFEE 6253]